MTTNISSNTLNSICGDKNYWQTNFDRSIAALKASRLHELEDTNRTVSLTEVARRLTLVNSEGYKYMWLSVRLFDLITRNVLLNFVRFEIKDTLLLSRNKCITHILLCIPTNDICPTVVYKLCHSELICKSNCDLGLPDL